MFRLCGPYLSEIPGRLFSDVSSRWQFLDGRHAGLLGKLRYEVMVPVFNAEHLWVGTFHHQQPGRWYLHAYPAGDVCWKGMSLDAGYRALLANPGLLPERVVSEKPAPFPVDVANGVLS